MSEPTLIRKSFSVPRDHLRTHLGNWELCFSLLGDPHSRRTPVVFLTGGPGESGIQSYEHPPFRRALDRLAQDRPVLLLDQRGCGSSEPFDRLPPLVWEPGDGLTPARVDARIREQVRQVLTPELLTLNPRQSAQDVLRLLDHLGLASAHVLAYSYGTHLAQALLKVGPERVRSLALCGCEGPDQTWKLPSVIRAAAERRAELDGWPGGFAAFWGLAEEVEPRDAGALGPISGAVLQMVLMSWLGISKRAAKLGDALQAWQSRDGEALERIMKGYVSMLNKRPPKFYFEDLASWASTARRARIAEEARALGGCHWEWGQFVEFAGEGQRTESSPLSRWGIAPLDDAFREPSSWDGVGLVFTGTEDAFTPEANLAEALQSVPNVAPHSVEGAFHDTLLDAELTVEMVAGLFARCDEPQG